MNKEQEEKRKRELHLQALQLLEKAENWHNKKSKKESLKKLPLRENLKKIN